MMRLLQWIMWSPVRLVTVLVAVALVIVGSVYVLTRPDDGPPTVAPSSAGPSPTASQGSPATVPDATASPSAPAGGVAGGADEPVPDAVLEPVQTYLQAKVNQVSVSRQDPADWLTEARPVLTVAYYDTLAAEMAAAAGGSLGWEWDQYHSGGWSVEVSDLSCHPHADVYDRSAPETALVCSYDVTLVDAAGDQVQDVPFGWYGEREALVSVTQADGWWRISGDSTGQAG